MALQAACQKTVAAQPEHRARTQLACLGPAKQQHCVRCVYEEHVMMFSAFSSHYFFFFESFLKVYSKCEKSDD
jgi:hypothetical protein